MVLDRADVMSDLVNGDGDVSVIDATPPASHVGLAGVPDMGMAAMMTTMAALFFEMPGLLR
ncbi:hypothetical protein E2562_028872 [Oryza meyeriana var. granulata]|uniref:Uncharacterized protein n=1 Tax=Oryza meyeriana var. granulata TaxID=110450 RepID=A0A6G1FDD3_9ORYZ|nr:hypothetical protein E2562_028872 [Oryza meyeriana var. granulata]